MATAGFGEQLTRRKKWITGLVSGVLAATVLVIVAGYWWDRARKDKALPVPQTLPTNIHQQLSGYSFTRSEEGRRIFTVHAARTVAFKQGGTTILEDVFVEVFGRTENRHDILRTRLCEYNAQSGDLFSAGKVEIELNARGGPRAGRALRPEEGMDPRRQPVVVETSRVSFMQRGSLAVSDQPVRFRIGSATGGARGLTYATHEGWLELRKDIVVELQPRGGSAPDEPVQLRASRLRYDPPRGASGKLELTGPVVVTQGNRRVLAERGNVLLDGQNRVTQVELEGGVKAFDSSNAGEMEAGARSVRGEFDPASGQLRLVVAEGDVLGESRRRGTVSRLVAQEVQMTFQGLRPRPQEGRASGSVQLTVEPSDPRKSGLPRRAPPGTMPVEKKTLAADQTRFAFQSDGAGLREIDTVGPGKLVIVPAEPKVGERVVTAGRFLMAFDKGSRLETLLGFSRTRIVFKPPTNAPAGTAVPESTSERLEATFDPLTQTPREFEQIGDFRFEDGDQQGSAERASYSPQSQVLTLIGRPQVWDATTRMRAERILFDLRRDTAEGLSEVQATHFESAAQRETGRHPAAQLPASTGAGSPGAVDPTNVLADRMVAARRSQFVHYEGHVRVWHGADVVESSALDVFRTERRVSSGSRVLTSHLKPATLVPETGTTASVRRESRPVTIRADRLEYFDEGRKASYRGNVQLQTESTTLQADRLDVYFRSAGAVETSEIERAVANGRVAVAQPTRHAKGERAEFDAPAGKILLTGGPPTLVDAEKGSTTGQRLTFFIRDDRLLADGGDESPTLTKHRVAQ